MVLRAYANLQHLPFDIDAVIAVQLDGRRVHRLQPLKGRIARRAAVFQIRPRFLGKIFRRVARGIAAKIHVHTPARVCLLFHQDVHLRGAGHLARVVGPLIALEEAVLQRRLYAQRVGEEFALHALLVHRHVARQHLLIAARYIPPEFHRGKPVLPRVQVRALRARGECHAAHTVMAERIDAVAIDMRRAARAQDYVRAGDVEQLLRVRLQTQKAAHAVCTRHDAEGEAVIHDFDGLGAHARLQRLGHKPAGERPGGAGAAARIVVGLIADVFSVGVLREGHAQARQAQEAFRRMRRLAKRRIAVDVLMPQFARERAHAVALVARKRELVIRLFIAARVARGAGVHVLREQHKIALAEHIEPVRRVEARAAGTDDNRSNGTRKHRISPSMNRSAIRKEWSVTIYDTGFCAR